MINKKPNGILIISDRVKGYFCNEKRDALFKYTYMPLILEEHDKEAKEISEYVVNTWYIEFTEDGIYNVCLCVIPDWYIAKKYVSICLKLNLKIRIFMVYSECNDWFWNGPELYGELFWIRLYGTPILSSHGRIITTTGLSPKRVISKQT
jgi:hypothetical protein